VVGPSGAGKDALLAGARRIVGADPRFFFVRRVITRPADAGGEDHESMDSQGFAAAEAAGGFALTWRAHGLSYGLPVEMAGEIAAGRIAVANGSRHVVADARRRFDTAVILVNAERSVRARRLVQRGRESEAEIMARLERETVPVPAGTEAITIENCDTLDVGVAAFVSALREVAAGA